MLTRSSLMASNPRSTPRARSLSGAGYDSPRVRPMPLILMATAKRNRSLLLSSPLAFSWPPLLWRLRAFAKFFYRITGLRHSRSSSSSSPSSSKESLFRSVSRLGRAIDSTAVKPTPGIIAPMPSLQWRQLSEFPSRLSAAKNGKVRMITRPFSPAALSRPHGARLLGPALREILDTAPRGEISETYSKRCDSSVPGVIDLEKCFVRKMGVCLLCRSSRAGEWQHFSARRPRRWRTG